MRQLNCVRPLILAIAVLAATRASLAAEAEAIQAALRSITDSELKELVATLADDKFEGRASGTQGSRAAGQYIVERLKKTGVAGGGPNGAYYQHFDQHHNILAFVEGRDPALKQQVIVVGAHYDHVGYGSPRNSYGPVGQIHNGADDNASGVACLLEVAEALARLPQAPARSILLAFWDGEEQGLLGSEYWVRHPTVPLDRVPIMINADMVGRLRAGRVEVYGVRTSTGLRRVFSQQNHEQLLLDFNWDMKADSDHYSFFAQKVPAVMLHTGLHADYHRPSDDSDRINVAGLLQVSRFAFELVVELADTPKLAGFRDKSRLETRAQQKSTESPQSAPPGRLGMHWEESRAAKGEVVVQNIIAGSAAEKAGLRGGDRILAVGDHAIRNIQQFRTAVLVADRATTLTVDRAGHAESLQVPVTLAGEPVRLGITWRTDDAEPGVVIINRVTAGSPAHTAGLQANDRIHRIGQVDFASGDEFRRMVGDQSFPILLEVETGGRVRTVEIPDPLSIFQ